jgi:L-asparagine transporter-like permease
LVAVAVAVVVAVAVGIVVVVKLSERNDHMSNILRTMARGSMAPHAWHGPKWVRSASVKLKSTGNVETTHGQVPGLLAKLRAAFPPKADRGR